MYTTEMQLLKAAKHMFLREGYDKTSLRTLCEQAHMTTGALYGLWPGGKRALFEALIEPAASMLFSLVEQGTRLDYSATPPPRQLLDQAARNGRSVRRHIVSFVWDHREAFILLLRRAAPSVTSAYIDQFIELEKTRTGQLLDYVAGRGYPIRRPDPISLHCFCTSFWQMAFYLLMESPSREHSTEAFKETAAFFTGGWRAVSNFSPDLTF